MKNALFVLIATSAVALAGCSSNNDLTGPTTASGPEATTTQGQSAASVVRITPDAAGAEGVESLPNDEMPASVGTESNDWRKADVIFPWGTRSIRFHLDDPYLDTFEPNAHVILSVDGYHDSYGVYVYSDRRAIVSPNSVFHFYPDRDGAYWTLRIKCDRIKWPDTFGFKGLNGTVRIDDPLQRPRSFKVGLGKTYKITFAVAAK